MMGSALHKKTAAAVIAGVLVLGSGISACAWNLRGEQSREADPSRPASVSSAVSGSLSAIAGTRSALASASADAEVKKKARALYRDFYDANWNGKEKAVFFADLTHDGVDEMLITFQSGEKRDTKSNLNVYTVSGGNVKRIYYVAFGRSHMDEGEIYLYTEDGRQYLYRPVTDTGNGGCTVQYQVFGLSADGKAQMHQSDSIHSVIREDLSASYEAGASQEREKAITNTMAKIAASARLLIRGECGEDRITFGTGEANPFQKVGAVSKAAAASSAFSRASSAFSRASSTFSRASAAPSTVSRAPKKESGVSHASSHRTAASFIGMTLKQLTARYGSDYQSDGNYEGGKTIRYADKRVPFTFALDSTFSESTDRISFVSVPEGEWADDKYQGGLTLGSLKAMMGSGWNDPIHNDASDTYFIQVKRSGYVIVYEWGTKDCSGKSWTSVWNHPI